MAAWRSGIPRNSSKTASAEHGTQQQGSKNQVDSHHQTMLTNRVLICFGFNLM